MRRGNPECNHDCDIRADHFPSILLGGRLCQQLIVDMGARLDDNRLDDVRHNQDKLGADSTRSDGFHIQR